MPAHQAVHGLAISLDDKWDLLRGRVLLNGTQAIARVLIAQSDIDQKAGLNTAGYISGYRGSPLGNVDTALWAAAKQLTKAHISFVPGVNEDLAATAVRGTQQIDFVPGKRVDGVFAAWYGKGPGVDRSLDALKHGNYAGVHPNGGVLVFYGDDHGGKSSTVSHHSEQAMAAASIPSLYPSNVSEIIEFGLLGYALSRYSGSWVGLKLVNEVAEQTMSVDLAVDDFNSVTPITPYLPPEGIHIRGNSYVPLREEQIVLEHRLPMVQEFVRANRIDRVEFLAPAPRLGLVAAGKSYTDTRQALRLLGLTVETAVASGISLYKVGCIWPLEPHGLTAFASEQSTLFVIEEKETFVELQAAQILVNLAKRPILIGKRDEAGAGLIPSAAQLEPIMIALAIAGRLEHLGIADTSVRRAASRLAALIKPAAVGTGAVAMPLRRAPYFCSGCPHSRSTRIPQGSISMTGIGCHTMVGLARPAEALMPTHMGGEGANWLGLSLYTDTPHIFQNMGDGTYYHSGLLAIRAAVASGASITYKILYNDAVAMTGGQPIDGPISVAEIAHQVLHEGVKRVIVLSDNPDAYRGKSGMPPSVTIGHRDTLDAVQKELRETAGCTVLIYEQTCAAEKRRRRKKGLYPDPPKRLFIATAVCEGCGDCSVQSTCVSLQPTLTDLGIKRRIDQSSCNKDYSCLNGFCPSFITVHDAEPRKPKVAQFHPSVFANLPEPTYRVIDEHGFSALVTGIGGTGIVTVAAILGMAAHIDGHASSMFDMTGLAQKNGAVLSHVRIGRTPSELHAQRIGRGETNLLLAFDLVGALADDALATTANGITSAVVNSDVVPTMAFQFNAAAVPDGNLLLGRLTQALGDEAVHTANATALATRLLGNAIGANMMMIGIAAQQGLLPVSINAVEHAIRLNGASVTLNLAAFNLGRLLVADPGSLTALLPTDAAPLDQSVDAIIARRIEHLTAYQNSALAEQYNVLVARVREAEKLIDPESEILTRTVVHNYAKVLAYKDEYEVARLLTSSALKQELASAFADGATFSYNLAPPILARRGQDGRPGKRNISKRVLQPLLGVVARARRLRGTPFDPFGYSIERRNERALATHYRQLIRKVLDGLNNKNLVEAAELLELVSSVRGYGPVKEINRNAYFEGISSRLAEFLVIGLNREIGLDVDARSSTSQSV